MICCFQKSPPEAGQTQRHQARQLLGRQTCSRHDDDIDDYDGDSDDDEDDVHYCGDVVILDIMMVTKMIMSSNRLAGSKAPSDRPTASPWVSI